MNAKHTPGPWHYSEPNYGGIGIKSEHRISTSIAIVHGATDEERQANAALIAAAPELLEALKKAKRAMEVTASFIPESADKEINAIYDRISEAIAHAEGRA